MTIGAAVRGAARGALSGVVVRLRIRRCVNYVTDAAAVMLRPGLRLTLAPLSGSSLVRVVLEADGYAVDRFVDASGLSDSGLIHGIIIAIGLSDNELRSRERSWPGESSI